MCVCVRAHPLKKKKGYSLFGKRDKLSIQQFRNETRELYGKELEI